MQPADFCTSHHQSSDPLHAEMSQNGVSQNQGSHKMMVCSFLVLPSFNRKKGSLKKDPPISIWGLQFNGLRYHPRLFGSSPRCVDVLASVQHWENAAVSELRYLEQSPPNKFAWLSWAATTQAPKGQLDCAGAQARCWLMRLHGIQSRQN